MFDFTRAITKQFVAFDSFGGEEAKSHRGHLSRCLYMNMLRTRMYLALAARLLASGRLRCLGRPGRAGERRGTVGGTHLPLR